MVSFNNLHREIRVCKGMSFVRHSYESPTQHQHVIPGVAAQMITLINKYLSRRILHHHVDFLSMLFLGEYNDQYGSLLRE